LNRILKTFGGCVLAALLVFACGDEDPNIGNRPAGTVLNSIAINTSNAKTEYKVYDEFDPSGLVVTARYTDGTSHIVSGDEYEVRSNNYIKSKSGTYSIRVFYKTRNGQYNVTVTDYNPYDENGYLNIITDIKKRTETNLIYNFVNMYHPFVLKEQLAGNAGYPYTMWFMGWAATETNVGWPGCDAVFLARGSDLYTWEVYCTDGTWDHNMSRVTQWKPVVYPGGQWYDDWHNGDASVVKRGGIFYMMLSSYASGPDQKFSWQTGDTDGDLVCVIGATSTDGINWVKSTEPVLMWKDENSKKWGWENGLAWPPDYYGHYHRPSLMFDESINKWRMWHDYIENGYMSMGYWEAEANADIMLPSSWVPINVDSNPAYRNFTNPDVIKIGAKYYAIGDPNIWYTHKANPAMLPTPPNNGWEYRQMMFLASHDGLTWRPVGWIYPDSDTNANHVACLYFENNTLYVFYAAQNKHNYMYEKIRVMEFSKEVIEKW